jgi:hypothetical protein
MQPPLLPTEIFQRLLRLAKLDGTGVLFLAGFFALMAAASRDYVGAGIGLLVAAAGAIELHGEDLLRHGQIRGLNWLIASQIYLMAVVLGYCWLRLTHVVIPPVPPNFKPLLEMSAQQWRMTTPEYLSMVYRLTFRLLAGLTVAYQGWMAFYYWQRRAAVERALAEE